MLALNCCRRVKLPPEDRSLLTDDEKDFDAASTRCSTRMSRYTVKVPRTAVAGLTGEMADKLHEIQDQTVRVSPVAQAWTPTGDIYISGNKGHLLKVSGSQQGAKKYVLFWFVILSGFFSSCCCYALESFFLFLFFPFSFECTDRKS